MTRVALDTPHPALGGLPLRGQSGEAGRGVSRVAHLFDASTGWQQRVSADQLLARLPRERFEQQMTLIDAAARRALGPLAERAALLPRRGLSFLTAPRLARHLHDQGIELVHAWGAAAAAAASHAAVPSRRPIVLSWFEPRIADGEARLLRTLAPQHALALACASASVRRRVIEKGIAPDACVVVRPGVDFALINQAKRSDLRARLGLTERQRVLIAPEPATRAGGHYVVFWTTAMRTVIEPDLRVIIPGESAEQRRIARLARQIGFERYLICPGAAVPFEELVSIADVLVVASDQGVSTTAIAWAFAASVPVVATATYANAELIAHNVNGLLVKPESPTRLASKIAARLEDTSRFAQLKETARGQAFEVFSMRRYAEQMGRLYDNLLTGRAPGDGVGDAAAA